MGQRHSQSKIQRESSRSVSRHKVFAHSYPSQLGASAMHGQMAGTGISYLAVVRRASFISRRIWLSPRQRQGYAESRIAPEEVACPVFEV
jgi:hypothetical protein